MKFNYFSKAKTPKDPRRSIILKEGYGKNWPSQRKAALERDHYTCQKCGHVGRKKGRRWDVYVHHRIKIKLFVDSRTKEVDYHSSNDLSNLITLCGICHKVADSHKAMEGFVMLK